MPDEAFLRSTLRDRWHLVPSELAELPATLLCRGWEFTAGAGRYLVRLGENAARQAVEAGLAAAEQLPGVVGEPVRALDGALTVESPHGTLAVLARVPGRLLDGRDPVDQGRWGERLAAVHATLQGFRHPGLSPWRLPDVGAPHLDAAPWLRAAVTGAVAAATRLTVTDQLTYGVLHGDPAPATFVLDPATGRCGLLHCGAGGIGPLVYDVAAAVAYAGGPERATELLDAYRAAGPVGADELEAALPVLLRLRWAVQADRAAREGATESLGQARLALEAM